MNKKLLAVFLFVLVIAVSFSTFAQSTIKGKVLTEQGLPIKFATITLKNTSLGVISKDDGSFLLQTNEGNYVLVCKYLGMSDVEQNVSIKRNETITLQIVMHTQIIEKEEIVIKSTTGVGAVRQSAYNAVAVDTKDMLNSTKTISDALSKAPGIKLRESGGVGSDMQVMLDGFSGKHVKIFIDGVPQEGGSNSFNLNNIPVNMAERIEVYKGVVPVRFGTDAIGGVINVVTKKQNHGWHIDASYTYGSFNTHKSYIDFGHTSKNGLTFMVKAFQNYSDNNYYINTAIEDFKTGAINSKDIKRVKRFHDTYHNEALQAKFGFTNKSWADKFIFGIVASQMHKDVQNSVRQMFVYGAKFREGNSINPTLEYVKNNIKNKLDISLILSYNNNITTNVDTSSVKYNWLGQTKKLNSPGEQSYQNSDAKSYTYGGNFTVVYRFLDWQSITFSDVLNSFKRTNVSNLTNTSQEDEFYKITTKNISGLSYLVSPNKYLNASAFIKYYNLQISGPIASNLNAESYEKISRNINKIGYGAAITSLIIKSLQAKLSYEKAYRLPTIEEMFGDEDLETGEIGINPENSDNFNFSLSYDYTFGQKNGIFVEGGLVYRSSQDYIQRNIVSLSGGRSGATYINYGKILTKGYNISLRYSYGKKISIGGNFTRMEVIDNMKTIINSTAENLAYHERIPNIPYMFADMDITYRIKNFIAKGNTLSIGYDNQYLHKFCYYLTNVGTNSDDFMIPNQFSHNAQITYSINNGKYNISFEAKNFTNEQLYDNYSLQKAGRAFYGKIRVYFGSSQRHEHNHDNNYHQHNS